MLIIQVSAPELVSGVSGDSESKIRDIFSQAIDNSPCVLFIDEIDCITPKVYILRDSIRINKILRVKKRDVLNGLVF